jgi:hypothetical protein
MQSLIPGLTGAVEDRRIPSAISSVIVAAAGAVAPLLHTTAAWRRPGGNDFAPYRTLSDKLSAARLPLGSPAAVWAGLARLLPAKGLREAPWARRRPVPAPVPIESHATRAGSQPWADRMNW